MTDWNNTSQNVAGDIKAVEYGIYYAGTDGLLHRYHFNNSTLLWEHDHVRDFINNQTIPIPANTDISLVGNADQIFFKGSDNQVHHLYSKYGNTYLQDYVICYNDLNGSYQSNGRIVSQSDGSTFYIGLDDNFIHMYAFDNGCNPRSETGERPANTTPARGNLFAGSLLTTEKIPMIDRVDEEKQDATAIVQIFPNPASSQLHVHTKNMLITVKIFDIYGRNIYTNPAPSSSFDINLEHMPEGVYMITVLRDGIVIKTEKVIKK